MPGICDTAETSEYFGATFSSLHMCNNWSLQSGSLETQPCPLRRAFAALVTMRPVGRRNDRAKTALWIRENNSILTHRNKYNKI